VAVEAIKTTFDKGYEDIFEDAASRHPLVVIATSVKVWPVQLRFGKYSLEPAKRIDVPHVHPECDLGLFSVSSKVPLAEEQPQNEPLVEGIKRAMFHGKHDGETIAGDVS
jgi:hypothetical protein